MAFTLKINGTPHEADVDADTPLLGGDKFHYGFEPVAIGAAA
jgi:hypothetical protein